MNGDAAPGSALTDVTAIVDQKQLLSEARDIDRVCRSRDLSTSEVFEPNAYYGNDIVLKRYAGLPADSSLKVVVPHGIVFDRTYVWDAERRAPLPAVLAYGGHRAVAYSRHTRKLIVRSAVPFAYLATMLGEEAKPRSGTLFFPSHSTHRITAQSDFAGMAERLAGMDARHQPVTVCIYWRDHELGRHLPFIERGLRVVSAGHIYDPAFLFRLYYLCQEHRYAASNHIGSSLLYSVLAGCSFFLVPGFGVTYAGAAAHLASDLSHVSDMRDVLTGAFAVPHDATSASQSDLVADVGGLNHLMSPHTLREVMAMADQLDRLGVARDPRRPRLYAKVPRRYVRAGRNLVLAARRHGGALVRPFRTDRRPRP